MEIGGAERKRFGFGNSGGYKFRSPLNLGILLSEQNERASGKRARPSGFVMRTPSSITSRSRYH